MTQTHNIYNDFIKNVHELNQKQFHESYNCKRIKTATFCYVRYQRKKVCHIPVLNI